MKLTLIPFPRVGKRMDREEKRILKENKEGKGFPIILYLYPPYKTTLYIVIYTRIHALYIVIYTCIYTLLLPLYIVIYIYIYTLLLPYYYSYKTYIYL